MNPKQQPVRITDSGIELSLADGTVVEISIAGGTCEGKVDDGCVGFTGERGEHQTVIISDKTDRYTGKTDE